MFKKQQQINKQFQEEENKRNEIEFSYKFNEIMIHWSTELQHLKNKNEDQQKQFIQHVIDKIELIHKELQKQIEIFQTFLSKEILPIIQWKGIISLIENMLFIEIIYSFYQLNKEFIFRNHLVLQKSDKYTLEYK